MNETQKMLGEMANAKDELVGLLRAASRIIDEDLTAKGIPPTAYNAVNEGVMLIACAAQAMMPIGITNESFEIRYGTVLAFVKRQRSVGCNPVPTMIQAMTNELRSAPEVEPYP